MQPGLRRAVVVLGLALLAAGAARALTPPQRAERRFLQEAAAAARFSAEASRLALEKSHSSGVRELAATVVNENTTMQPELLHFLHARGMAMPMADAAHFKALRAMQKLSGARFDQLYLEQVALRSHTAQAAAYERAAGEVGDPALKAWIERKLPALRQRLGMAGRGGPAGGPRLVNVSGSR